MTLIDRNVILDVVTDDPGWAEWAVDALTSASLAGPLCINDVVYAELAVRYETIEDLDGLVAGMQLDVMPIPRAALFLASKAFLRYRRSAGTRTSVLTDFFMGAHAAVAGMPLLTRDVARYRTCFPTVELITPR